MPDHSPQSQPSVDSPPTECGWTLGFRHGTACTAPRADEAVYCGPHLQADRRIDAYASRAARRAYQDLENDLGGTFELRLIEDPRPIAERWWLKQGVRAIPTAVRQDVLESGPCAYCGFLYPTEVDHILPVSRGGLSERANLAPSCERCNGEKLDMTVDEWRTWRRRNGMCWPPKTLSQLAKEQLERLRAIDPPPEFLADLMCMPEPAEMSATYQDDPRWQAANLAWLGDDDTLSRTEVFMRRHLAVQVMYEIELAYETREAS